MAIDIRSCKMASYLQTKAGVLAEQFMQEIIPSGLTWNEAVVVFALAVRAAAQTAQQQAKAA